MCCLYSRLFTLHSMPDFYISLHHSYLQGKQEQGAWAKHIISAPALPPVTLYLAPQLRLDHRAEHIPGALKRHRTTVIATVAALWQWLWLQCESRVAEWQSRWVTWWGPREESSGGRADSRWLMELQNRKCGKNKDLGNWKNSHKFWGQFFFRISYQNPSEIRN